MLFLNSQLHNANNEVKINPIFYNTTGIISAGMLLGIIFGILLTVRIFRWRKEKSQNKNKVLINDKRKLSKTQIELIIYGVLCGVSVLIALISLIVMFSTVEFSSHTQNYTNNTTKVITFIKGSEIDELLRLGHMLKLYI